MNTVFINSENSKTSDSLRLPLNFIDKIDLRRKDKIFLYQIFVFTISGKLLQSHIEIIDLKYQL